MTVAIAVTSPDLVLPPLDPQALATHALAPRIPPAAVLPPPRERSLEDALEAVRRLLDQHGYVVVLYAGGEARIDLHHRLHTVRSVLDSDRIALLRLDLPPLAIAVLALQLRLLAAVPGPAGSTPGSAPGQAGFSPGVLASAARLLSHYVYAGALLGSVSRLDSIPVSLASHATSWVPGTQFAALVNPGRRLVKMGPAAQEALEGPEFGTRILVAKGRLPSDWVASTLAPAWRVHDIRQVPLPRDSAEWWGTGRLVEFAAAIQDPAVLHRIVDSVHRARCRWCGLELLGDHCAFCAAPLAPAEGLVTPAQGLIMPTQGPPPPGAPGPGAPGLGGPDAPAGPPPATAHRPAPPNTQPATPSP
ncbi:hypothetical protein AB0C51_04630 [Streptomyces pathocidini]|uniref:hypothetical protein n=1 Tax=Streptomyces pathocidini TaxID=1650571 RepID=UPI0033D75AF8